MKVGQEVKLRIGERTIEGIVQMASPNANSLAVDFDGMFGGFLGCLLLYRNRTDEAYRVLWTHEPVEIEELPGD